MTTNLQSDVRVGLLPCCVYVYSLVENRDTAEFAAVPFGLVFVKFGVNGLQEGAHKRDFHRWADNGALEVDVFHCIR